MIEAEEGEQEEAQEIEPHDESSNGPMYED